MAAVACAVGTLTVPGGAVDLTMDLAAVDAAVRLGQSRADTERASFHAAYRFDINKMPLDYVELVTPFRRVVLTAETRARIGDRIFGQRQALAVLNESGHQLDVHAEITFHPLNTFVTVPRYVVSLEQSGTRIEPARIEAFARYGARVEGTPPLTPVPGGIAPGKSQPMLGATLVARFDRTSVRESAVYDVVIRDDTGRELGRARVDFAKLR